MKRLPSVVVRVLLLLALSVIIFFNDTGRARTPPANAQTQGGAAAVTPNASGSVAAQTGETVEAQRGLQCQNCHGPTSRRPAGSATRARARILRGARCT